VFEDELPKATGSGKNVFVERLWATRRIGQIIDEIDLHGESGELVDELIVLSKRHGILTPYTAYLAEERTDLNDISGGRRMARIELESLQEESGADAFYQRDFKSRLKRAGRAATPSEASDALGTRLQAGSARGAAPASRRSLSTGGGRFGFSSLAKKLDDSAGNRPDQDAEGIQRVKHIGAKTFFLRKNRYVDSDATKEQIAVAIKIEQFSDQYFDLLVKLDEESRVYLAEESELLVVLKGKTYLIVPPKPDTSTK
jgi:Ca-activated chloride channel family protein